MGRREEKRREEIQNMSTSYVILVSPIIRLRHRHRLSVPVRRRTTSIAAIQSKGVDNLTTWLLRKEQINEIDSELAIVLSSISLACKQIASLLQRSTITNLTGAYGTINVQGEDQKKLDVISNENLKRYLEHLRQPGEDGKPYSGRYIGCLVGEIHRMLLRGGIYGNPNNSNNKNGNLSLLYECAPMSYLVEQAGGKATDGHRRILDITPSQVHQRTPIFIGSPDEIDKLQSYLA